MKIFGVAGSFASGKDTVGSYLQDVYGLLHISTSDIVREESQKRYGSIERPILYKTANEIRHERGHGALSEIALERYTAVKDQYPAGLVVSGFRALAEARVIRQAGGDIIFVDAPFDVRYERMKQRSRDGEAVITKDAFLERERSENGGVDQAFNIAEIKDTADIVIHNDMSLKDFEQQIDAFYSQELALTVE